MNAIGVWTAPIILPHTKGSLRIQVEFVVLLNGLCDYLILGNDALCLYGIDVFQSQGRYFTMGGN